MLSNVLTNIRTKYSTMSPSGKSIADYVLAHGQEVIHMPITELAYRCCISETSIIRFCRVVDTFGYQDFRLALSSALASEERAQPKAMDDRDEDSQRICSICTRFRTIIQGTLEMLKPEKLQRIVKYYNDAGQVFLFGSRDAMNITMNAGQMLLRSLHKGRYVADGYSQSLLVDSVAKDDLVIFLSACSNDQELYKLAERVKNRQAKLVSISCCGPTLLDGLCGVSLYCGRNNPAATPEEILNEQSLNLASMSLMTEIIRSFCMESISDNKPKAVKPANESTLPQEYFPAF